MEQVRQADARYQIGSGKVEELAELVEQKTAEKVIFDNLLRPVQSYNLAKATKVEIIDRFQLILEIFTKKHHDCRGADAGSNWQAFDTT